LWGNRAVTGTALSAAGMRAPSTVTAYSGNRWTDGSPDAAGNLTAPTIGSARFAYDAENRVSSGWDNSSTPVQFPLTYGYDADGRRVSKAWCLSGFVCSTGTAGAKFTTYVYDAGGDLAMEIGPSAGSTGAEYLFADHLGSTRIMVERSTGTTHCYDYSPFGEELDQGLNGRGACYEALSYPSGSFGSVSEKFTGKERDAETGLDYFGARYFSGAQGRFTTPDEPLVDQHTQDPQSWNLYSYVRNNPLRAVDQDGRECVTLDGGGTGDDGKGKACSDPSLQTTHGVTVNGDTGETTARVFGNAVLMGHIDLSGRKDSIISRPDELMFVLSTAQIPVKMAAALGDALSMEVDQLVAKAAATTGNESAVSSSRSAAEAAAKKFVGTGSRPIVDRATGKAVGEISSDGGRIARFTSVDKPQPYINLENKASGGNLHVRW